MSDETDGQLLYSNESVATAPSVEELVFDESRSILAAPLLPG
jgi:hypothetical protein